MGQLIQFGASAAQKDALGYTPQMLAVLHGNCDILEILVMADKEATNEQDMVYGRTPLHWACAVNCAKVANELILNLIFNYYFFFFCVMSRL